MHRTGLDDKIKDYAGAARVAIARTAGTRVNQERIGCSACEKSWGGRRGWQLSRPASCVFRGLWVQPRELQAEAQALALKASKGQDRGESGERGAVGPNSEVAEAEQKQAELGALCAADRRCCAVPARCSFPSASPALRPGLQAA